jgi:succinyl-diaminopimelate desuccinylase
MTDLALSAAEEALLDGIDAAEAVAFLQALICARSSYPPGDTQQALDVVADKLATTGIAARRYAANDAQPNLIAELPGEADGPTLVFHAHVDTVGAGDGWDFDPFGGEIDGGRLYGRGAGDDKGSVAAQVMALACLARAGVALNGRLQVAVVADEESGGMAGTRWLRDEGRLQPNYLVVGEQTDNRVAVAERVACGIDLEVFGTSAHGAMPWAGENAILHTAQALSWLETHLIPRLGRRAHPFLPPPTLNIGVISGGSQWNIVPDRCTVAMDRRLVPGESREEAMAEIRAALDEFAEQVRPLRYRLSSEGDVAANINTSPTNPFVRAAAAALQAVTGERRDLSGYMQTSDGRWFAADGMPIIIFGPGDPALAHAANEFIHIEQFIEAIRFLTLLAWRWLGKE